MGQNYFAILLFVFTFFLNSKIQGFNLNDRYYQSCDQSSHSFVVSTVFSTGNNLNQFSPPAPVPPPPPNIAPCTQLFISEYVEGSNDNKAIEIFNPTEDTISLNPYKLKIFQDGANSNNGNLNLQGEIGPMSTFVIGHPQASSSILSKSDTLSLVVDFNGNDAIALFKGNNRIDIIGKIGENPGSKWEDGGVSTKNKTLVRKPSVTFGRNVNNSFNPSLQWDQFPSNTSDSLGNHFSNCPGILCSTDTTLYVIVCDSITLGDSTYFLSTIVMDTLINMNSCDSVITSNITINDSDDIMLDSVFALNSITLLGNTFTESQNYYQFLNNVKGCDSTVTTPIQIDSILSGNLLTSQNFEEFENGWLFSISPPEFSTNKTKWDTVNSLGPINSGSYGNHFWGMRHVEQIQHKVRFNPFNITGQENVVLSFDYYTRKYSNSDEIGYSVLYNDTALFNTFNMLETNLNQWVTIYDTIPAGTNFVKFGLNVMQKGKNEFGGFDNLQLISYPCFDEMVFDTLYNCGAYTFNGVQYDSTSTIIDSLTSIKGCDSIINTFLIIDQTTFSTQVDTITCQDSLLINNIVYNTNGQYVQDLHSVMGCDSTVNFNIVFNVATDSTHVESTCLDSLVFGSFTYNTTGEYIQYLTNVKGCDSTLTLELVFKNESSSTFIDSTCTGVMILNGDTFTETGNYTQVIENMEGCDSTIALSLFIHEVSETTIVDSSCTGEIVVNGETYTQSGVYTQELTNIFGCDSTLTLNLDIHEETSQMIIDSTCSGQMIFNDEVYTETGIYTQTLENVDGCDSTLTLQLVINEVSAETINETTCLSSLTYNGTSYSSTGVYTQTLVNSVGCDSVLTLDLVFNVETSFTYLETTCSSSLSFNGITYNSTGVYSQTLTNALGCDSNLTLDLTFNSPSTGTIDSVTCSNALIINGFTYNQTGDFEHIILNEIGCDSIITLDLVFNTSSTNTLYDSTCNSSIIINSITYLEDGSYTQTLTNSVGCDSILTVNVTLNLESSPVTESILVCEPTIDINGTTYSSTGVYPQTFTNIYGCDSIINYDLSFTPGDSTFLDTVICGQNSFYYEGFGIYNTGIYEIADSSVMGCPAITQINVIFEDGFTPTISQVGSKLEAGPTPGTFEWVNCDNGFVYPETSSTFTPYENGEYYVAVTQDGCTYKTDCIATFGISVEEIEYSGFSIYPNPNKGQFNLELNSSGNYSSYRIVSLVGQILYEADLDNQETLISINQELPVGLYYIQLLNTDLRWESQKLVIE